MVAAGDERGGAPVDATSTDVMDIFQAERLVTRPFLFLVLEADRPLAGGARFSIGGADEVVIGRGPRREATRAKTGGKTRLTVTANSTFLSSSHARLREEREGWTIEDLGSRNGVFVNGRQVTRAVLGPGDVVALGRVFFLVEYHEVQESSDADPSAGDADIGDADAAAGETPGLLTLLPGLAARIEQLRFEARRNTMMTVVGETGTGKEVLARAIHRLSARPGPYVAINCGSIPRELIQSELFGNVKGAFSGATGSPGYVRDAHQGTLLLDEIVAAPPEVQVALLRVLQEKVVTPVGSTRAHPVDVRFVAAAQRPLAEAVAAGGFRKDLQGRLEAFVFELPPLRERAEDLGVLLGSCLRAAGATAQDAPRLTPEAALRLLSHDWPLNVRELAHAVERSWARAKGGVIDESELPKPKPLPTETADIKDQLVASLRTTRGNVAETARRMGRARPLVHRWIKRFGIDLDSFRS
jgi:transcriptional regulator with PAS, ATPase and Fis domain